MYVVMPLSFEEVAFSRMRMAGKTLQTAVAASQKSQKNLALPCAVLLRTDCGA
jgi:hypothetical protein